MEAALKLHRLYASAVIAGGYPRDIILGAEPKDIDIFIDSTRFPSQERRDNAADNIFAAFGQTWTRDPVAAGFEANNYGAAPAGQLDDGFQVYYSISNEGEWENLNLIFSRNNERVMQFDWSICRAFAYSDGIEFGREARNLENIQLMFTENMPLVIKHAKRIKDKYPTAVFKIPTRYVNTPNIYRQLLEGGVIDGPREILQAQGQNGGGDQVRQHIGAGAGYQAGAINYEAWVAQQQQAFNQPINRGYRTARVRTAEDTAVAIQRAREHFEQLRNNPWAGAAEQQQVPGAAPDNFAWVDETAPADGGILPVPAPRARGATARQMAQRLFGGVPRQ